MSNFVVVVDPDESRRTRFVRDCMARLAPVDGLRVSCVGEGEFTAAWAASAGAPVSCARSHAKAGVLWGEALADDSPRRRTASEVLEACDPSVERPPPVYDGFHAGVVYGPTPALIAHADLLGLFPVYYAASKDVLVVGSSPELFRLHPSFPTRLCTRGLVALLLTHSPLGGRTLLQGVRRLAAGHSLVWSSGKGAREVRTFEIPPPREAATAASFRDSIESLHATYADVMRRHAPRERPYGLLLSGGRDSRTLAGYLRLHGNDMRALTLGRPSDYDVDFGARVARSLRIEHQSADIDATQYPWAAEMQAQWEHLTGGFSSIHTWGAVGPVRSMPDRLVCGYLAEMGRATGSGWVGGNAPEGLSFEELFRVTNRRALAPSVLRRLLRFPGAVDQIDEACDRMRRIVEDGSPVPEQRASRFFLSHHSRFHAGGVPWRLSFGSWPVLPALDRRLLAEVASVPWPHIADRRAQDHILRTHFPRLARLPLDRNSHDVEPLHVPLHRRAARTFRVGAVALRGGRALSAAEGERRYYYRMYDFEAAGWQAVRALADRHRDAVQDLFDPVELGRVVPPAGTPARHTDSIRDGFGPKLLVGFLLWARTHL